MRKLYAVLAMLGLFVTGFFATAVPAQAAADVTIGGTCKLSANWTVNVSVNLNNTSYLDGLHGIGTVDYIVMSSPGPLNVSGTNGSEVWFGQNDTSGSGHTTGTFRGFNLQPTGPGPYVYRADFGGSAGIPRVYITDVNPRSSTGVFCDDYSYYVHKITPN